MDNDRDAGPDLHLLVNGVRIPPAPGAGLGLFRLALPADDILLVSRTDRPSRTGLAPDDRLLGVALQQIAITAGPRRIAIPATHADLCDGFHEPEAGLRWTNGAARLPASLFRGLTGTVEMRLHGFALPAYRRFSPEAENDTTLFDRFESLGEDCEFGLVQRHFNVEPISLLRWAATDPERLLTGLRSSLIGVGDPERTALVWNDDASEYKLRDPVLSTHTWAMAREPSAEAENRLRLAGCARLRLMRRKLLSDIARGRRIFVFKSAAGDALFGAIHAAFRRLGPASLLCVHEAASPAEIGKVEAAGDGLYIGTIDRFSRDPIAPDVWRTLCTTTARLADAA